MSALVVGGAAVATVTGVGLLAVEQFMKSPWLTTGSPEAAVAYKKQMTEAGALLGGVALLGLFLSHKGHTDIGRGMMLGSGGWAALLVYTEFFEKKAVV